MKVAIYRNDRTLDNGVRGRPGSIFQREPAPAERGKRAKCYKQGSRKGAEPLARPPFYCTYRCHRKEMKYVALNAN